MHSGNFVAEEIRIFRSFCRFVGIIQKFYSRKPKFCRPYERSHSKDISDMVAALTNGPAAGIASTSDCADL